MNNDELRKACPENHLKSVWLQQATRLEKRAEVFVKQAEQEENVGTAETCSFAASLRAYAQDDLALAKKLRDEADKM